MTINAEFVVMAVRGRITKQGSNPNEYTARQAWAILAEMAHNEPDLAASEWYTKHSTGGTGFTNEWNKELRKAKRWR